MTTNDYPEVALAWIDVETTGLNPWKGLEQVAPEPIQAQASRCRLLEIAIQVTDLELNILDGQGLNLVVFHTPEQAGALRSSADPFVQDMHERTGLWHRISDPLQATAIDKVDTLITDHLRKFAPEPRTARVAGNSVRLDLNFIEAELPNLYRHVHYRMLDVSSWSGPAQWWQGITPMPKKLAHTATADIRESIAEMRYLREALGLSAKPMTISQVQAALSVSRATVDRMLNAGLLRVATSTPGGHRRVDPTSVREFLRSRAKPADGESQLS